MLQREVQLAQAKRHNAAVRISFSFMLCGRLGSSVFHSPGRHREGVWACAKRRCLELPVVAQMLTTPLMAPCISNPDSMVIMMACTAIVARTALEESQILLHSAPEGIPLACPPGAPVAELGLLTCDMSENNRNVFTVSAGPHTGRNPTLLSKLNQSTHPALTCWVLQRQLLWVSFLCRHAELLMHALCSHCSRMQLQAKVKSLRAGRHKLAAQVQGLKVEKSGLLARLGRQRGAAQGLLQDKRKAEAALEAERSKAAKLERWKAAVVAAVTEDDAHEEEKE